jgi:hypothetical protein
MAVSMDILGVFVGQSARDLGVAVHAGMVVIREKLGLYKTLAEGPSELSRTGTIAGTVARCMGTHGVTKTSGNCVTVRRKRHQSFVLRRRLIVVVLSCVLFAPSQSYSECAPNHEERVVRELLAVGKQGDTIARARGQVLEILQYGNVCPAWFQEADPDATEVFRSLHFALEMRGPSYVYGIRDSHGGQSFKHPWAAKSLENGGRDSTILLNVKGPFFNRTSVVMQLDPGGMPARPDGDRLLRVSTYDGNTPEAQIAILLHELGHIIGRLPEDDDSWDGRSSRNTSEVLQHCKAEIRAAAHNSPGGNI